MYNSQIFLFICDNLKNSHFFREHENLFATHVYFSTEKIYESYKYLRLLLTFLSSPLAKIFTRTYKSRRMNIHSGKVFFEDSKNRRNKIV